MTRRPEGGLLITVTTAPDVQRSRGRARSVAAASDAMRLVAAFVTGWTIGATGDEAVTAASLWSSHRGDGRGTDGHAG
jgi:hypothetical protein